MSADEHPPATERPGDVRVPVLADVALLAGVSQQTVSRVVRGSPSVARRTRERVEAAIAELGYRPNVAARTLVTRRSHRIGVIAADASLYGAAVTLSGIQQACRDAGYAVSLVVLSDLEAASIQRALEELRAQYVDGAIAVVPQDASQDALREADIAFPYVLAPGLDGAGAADAYWAEVAAARAATDHLLDLGHATVHHVAGPGDWAESRARSTGWRTALVERLRFVPRPVRGDWSAASGYAAVGELPLDSVTALFVANDHMALGVLSALAARGLRVPDDVSVVGYDDVPDASFYAPPLTTVHQDFAEIGRRCVQVLLGRLHDRVVEPGPVSPRLVVRDSTAAPGTLLAVQPG